MKKFGILLILSSLLMIGFTVNAQSAQSYVVISNGNSFNNNFATDVASAGGSVDVMYDFGVAVVTSSNPNFANGISGVRSVVPNFTLDYVRSETVAPDTVHTAVDASSVGNVGESAIAVWPFDDAYEVNEHDYTDLLWGLDAVNAQEAWAAGNTGEGVVVAVLDGGFDLDHPDFPAYTGEISFVPDESVVFDPALDGFSHGSHVAGTIASPANGFGVTGVAPNATIMPVKVLGDAGTGSFDSVIAGIYYAASQGADVINMSLGASIPQGTGAGSNEVAALRVAMNRAVSYAFQQGTVVITSAGNDSNNTNADGSLVVFPADMPQAVSISALGPEGWALDPSTDLDTLAVYSNFGRSGIDFGAPGGDYEFVFQDRPAALSPCIVSDTVDLCVYFDFVLSLNYDSYEWSVGTSMAAPHAAGVAALIIAANGGDMHPAQVEARMLQLSDDLGQPGNDPVYGNGRVSSGY